VSLRLKLVLLVVGLTTGLLGALGLVMGGALRAWTEAAADADLTRRADALTHEARFDDGKLELDDDDELGARGLPFRIETTRGDVLLGSAGWPQTVLPALGFATIESRTGEQVRILSVTFSPRQGTERLVLRVAAPLAALSGLADRFRAGLLWALLLAAGLSAGGATLLASWFLAPLSRVSREVDAIEARALTARLDTGGLDPELLRVATAFNRLLARVAMVFEGQRDFVARASHALRTPLASMLAQAEVALRRERSAESYRETIEALVEATRDAARLTDGLLALTRADAANVVEAREVVNLTDVSREVQRLFGARAEVSSLRLDISVAAGLAIVATRSRLRESLDALLDNAFCYTPKGGVVTFAARAEGQTVVLEVVDNGPGIRLSERAQVFERFFRGSAAAESKRPGSGLGLALVKALVEADGGSATLDDAPGGGTRVSLIFPNR
jgi:two-component system OmpR family sensor kinase